jgi:hypothetical protein
MMALTTGNCEPIAELMRHRLDENGLRCRTIVLPVDNRGRRLT